MRDDWRYQPAIAEDVDPPGEETKEETLRLLFGRGGYLIRPLIAALLLLLGACIPACYLYLRYGTSLSSLLLQSPSYSSLPLSRALSVADVSSTSSFDGPLRPTLTLCEANPVLGRLNRSQIIGLEAGWKAWYGASLSRAQQLSVVLSNGVPISDYRWYPAQLPTLDHNVCGKTSPRVEESGRYIAPLHSLLPCPSLSIYGRSDREGDTGKWLCEGDALLDADECRVYSLGSNNQFDFEEAILAQFSNCTVFTFDCTSSPPRTAIPRLHFEKACVGDRDEIIEGRQYRTLQSLMKANGHRSVSLLKMDIETYEFDVFRGLLADPFNSELPYQMSFETHYVHLFALPAVHITLFDQLYYAGYRVVSHENNANCKSCNEWTVVRVYC